MAGAGSLIDLKEQSITVAIGKPTNDVLGMSARFAFEPKLIAGTAPIVHQAGFQGFRERLLIHPAHHENPAWRGGFPHDGRDQSIDRILKIEIHSLTPTALAQGEAHYNFRFGAAWRCVPVTARIANGMASTHTRRHHAKCMLM